MPIALIFTIWVAGLSTVLGGIKFWQGYRNRKRMLIRYLFTGDPSIGDKITIHNPSKSAMIIEHWELLWVTNKYFGKKIVPIDVFNNDDRHMNLAANSIKSLNFNGQYHFNWSPKIENNVKLFIKLRIAGRKRLLIKRVHPINYSAPVKT